MNNMKNFEDKSKYINTMFTEKGYKTLKQYTKTFVKLYLEKEIYPFKQSLVLGMPMIKATQIIYNKKALLERIKILFMLLGINKITVEVGDGTQVTVDIRKEGEQ